MCLSFPPLKSFIRAFRAASLGLALATVGLGATPVVLPATAVGSSVSQNVTFSFPAAATVTGFSVLYLGAPNLDFTGSDVNCVAKHAKGSTCSLAVKFSPKGMGNRLGAVELTGTSGILQTIFISGVGLGQGVNFTPRQRTEVGTFLGLSTALAFDAQGDLYAADFPTDSSVGRVLKIPLVNGVLNTAQQTVVVNPNGGPALANPGGLAFDGAGDLFVADYYDSEVIEMPAGGGANVVVETNLNNPAGLVFDGAGDLFIADQVNNRVLEIPSLNGQLNAAGAIALGSTTDPLNQPADVAFDNNGNLIVADWGSGRVVKIPAIGGVLTSSAQTTLLTDLDGQPSALALDAAGDLYLALEQANSIEVIPNDNGAYSAASAYLVATGLNGPDAIKVDAAGNIYYGDTYNGLAYRADTVDPAALGFGTLGAGLTSAPQTVPVLSTGNQPLSISSISYGASFPNLGTTCTGTLAAGWSCDFTTGFAPTALGAVAQSAVITDNAVNQTSTTQTIALSGTGVQGPQTITFAAQSLVYGAAPLALSATGGPSGNPIVYSIVSGPGKLSGSSLTATGVGTILVAANQAGNTTYLAATQVEQVITVTPAILTVTASPVSISFGAAIPATFGYTITGFVNSETATVVTGTPAFSTSATSTSLAGTYPLTASFGTLAAANYNFVFVPAVLTITQATPTGSWISAAGALVYGQNLGTSMLDATSPTPGTFTYSAPGYASLSAGSVLPAGSYTVTATFHPFDTTDYSSITLPAQNFSIAKAVLTVTAAPTSVAFGLLPVLNQYTITGFVNGDTAAVVTGSPTLSVAGLSVTLAAGSYPITVSTAGMSAANYTFVAGVGGTLTVGKATPPTTWSPAAPTTLTFGTTLAGLLNASSTVPGTWLYQIGGLPVTSATVKATGTYSLDATFTPTDSADYSIARLSISITVNPATLTYTAANGTMVAGGAVPALSYTVTGFQNGDGLGSVVGAPILTTTASPSSLPGSYPITLSVASMTAENYIFVGVPGTLVVTGVPSVSLTAAGTLVYGEPLSSGVVAGSNVPGTWSFSANGTPVSATANLSAGVYNLVGTFTPTDGIHYSSAVASIPALTVSPATLTVSANNASMAAGAAVPALGYAMTGFVNGDTQATAVTGAPNEATAATSSSAAGTYPITIAVGTLAAANYTFQFVPATLTISAVAALPYSSITSITHDFTQRRLAAGATLWLSASFDAQGAKDGTVLAFGTSTLSYTLNQVPVTVVVPAAVVTFSASVTVASTTFDASTQTWRTTLPVPSNNSDSDHDNDDWSQGSPALSYFLDGFALPAPGGGSPANLDDATWSGTLSTNNQALSLNWQWTASSYSSLSADYNALGVEAATTADPRGHRFELAGTPLNFQSAAPGNGGFDGGYDWDDQSGPVSVVFTAPVPQAWNWFGNFCQFWW